MMPLITVLASCVTDNSINGITLPKCHAAHCFSYLELMNGMVLLTIPLVSHDADASANSVK